MRLYEVVSKPKEQLLRDANLGIGYELRMPSLSPFGDRAVEEAVTLFNKNGGQVDKINSLLSLLQFCIAPVKFSGNTDNNKIFWFSKNANFENLAKYGGFPTDQEIRAILNDNIAAGDDNYSFVKVDPRFQKFAKATHTALGYLDTLRSTVKFSEKPFHVAIARATLKELGAKYVA